MSGAQFYRWTCTPVPELNPADLSMAAMTDALRPRSCRSEAHCSLIHARPKDSPRVMPRRPSLARHREREVAVCAPSSDEACCRRC